MTAFATNISAQRVRLSVCKLNSLTAHPACIAGCLESINNADENLRLYSESDPAIALAIINLCRQQEIPLDFANLNFASLLRQIPKSQLVKTILAIDQHESTNEQKLHFIMNLNLRSGLSAYTARLIAEKSATALASQAFIAGLFADIGLLALAQLFSKSIEMLFEEAKGQRNTMLELENQYLGNTDNALSNQLLTKLQFPAAIAEAVWLAPKATGDLIAKLPNGKLIAIVRLAEILSSPTITGDISYLTKHLFLTDSDISQIRQKTADHHTRIGKLFGPENKDYRRAYLEAIENIYLKQLSTETSEDNFAQFAQKFLGTFLPNSSLADAAETAAKIFAESFLAQKLCVFTADTANADLILSYVIDGSSARSVLLNSPDGFTIADAEKDDLPLWLFEQIGIESEKSYYIPIKNAGQTVAGIILDGPMPDKKLLDKITSLLGVIFALAGENDHQKQITQITLDTAAVSEPVQIAKPQPIVQEQPIVPAPAAPAEKQNITQLAAELAAGAAHELNNPLAIISGRAQMLIHGESDETRQQILSQIVEKTKDIEEIIGQLMCYAKPPAAQIRTVSPFIVINNCLEKVNARYLSEPLDIHLENIENLSDIEVDAEQLAESFAQLIYNALESYESGNGQVQIIGAENSQSVEITIRDYGCGMSEETLAKAAEPFFSDKPAGRQRGMGLSIAAGLLKNNNCTIKMESQPDAGTTVRLTLPRAF
ncbi:MAG: ATP-binding protein [Phycisphaerae bacterium]|jgi:signal transduction histidine kinase